MNVRLASVYKRENKFIICANARTKQGFLMDNEPFVLIEEPVGAENLGKAIKEALNQFKSGIDAPDSGDDLLDFFATLAGVKNYNLFMKGALYCSVELEDAKLSFLPMKNDGDSFDPTGEKTAEIRSDASDATIGQCALDCIAHSK